MMTDPDIEAIERGVLAFTRTGEYPGGVERLKSDITALTLVGKSDGMMKILEGAGGTAGCSKPIADHYRPGPGRYEQRWPIAFPLPMPFELLDRPTQFAVLFGEWTRREMEASHALLTGDSGLARTIFTECLERAAQVDVPELEARSHEGLARVAAMTNERALEREHLKRAVAARASE